MKNKKLNKEQLAAIKHKKGPLLIIAGAGTGKTTVVTERIKYLIEKELAKPSEILALTFTEKAAREMEERVDIAMPYGYTQMWISTFHSFCDRILRAEALHVGLNPRFKLMTQAVAVQLIRENLFKFKLKYFRPLVNPNKFIGGMLQHFSRLQDEDVSPSEYLKWVEKQKRSRKKVRASHGAKSLRDDSAGLESLPAESKLELEKWKELAGAYKTYDELKIKENFMDFGDLIVKTLHLFKERPNVLAQYRKQFKYVLVDEFQDTNYAQNKLAMLVAGKGRGVSGPGGPLARRANITVTGDDDQSVYRFRGAAVSNIIQFRKFYPKAKIVVLTKNYRTTQGILDKAYDLIQHNNPDRLEVVENINKRLTSQVDGSISRKATRDDVVKFLHLDRVENEAEDVAREIGKLVVDSEKSEVGKKYDFKDFAILVRANNHAELFMRALGRHAIPCQFLGPGRLFKQAEVIDLISYLRVLYNFEDNVSFYRLLLIDYFDISARDLVKISNHARKFNKSLFESVEKIDEIDVSKSTKKKINKILKIINKHLKLLKKETAGQLLYYFLQDAGLIQKLLNPDTIEAEKKAKNVSKLFDKLKTYEVDHEDAGVSAVVDWLELSAELGESPLAADNDWTQINAVNILTVHSAKGLEFPVVFLVNLVGQRFPTNERREQIPIPDELIKEILPQGDFHQQEERRLFYVGMTRAQEKLYFTAANYYGEGKREKKLSPFIFEALGDGAVGSERLEVRGEQISFLDYESKTKSSKALVKKGRPPLHIDYLSYSQIQTFQICPLHYKLSYILKIPTPASAALSFGFSIHEVMKDFYNEVRNGTKPSGPEALKGRWPTNRLFYKLLKTNWMAEGYKSKAHEKKMFERGKKYLSGYLKKEFDFKNLPLAIEQPFMVSLDFGKRGQRLKIGGTIDRVDKLPGGGIEIIDYKTGEKVPDQKQADKDLQLTFYALAATKIPEAPFVSNPEKIKLSLYYFEDQIKISTYRTRQQLKEAEKEIFEWREKIEKSDFRCSNHYICQKGCEYSLMCRGDT